MYCFISSKKVPKNELRKDVITSFSNSINVTNEGNKHGSYERFLLKKKKTVFVNQNKEHFCKST